MSIAILYEKDWDDYPTAVIDTGSRNTSWVQQCANYKAMGVRHWYFPLALLQPVLAQYDPHDPNLPEDIKLLMILECEKNPWYFLREVLRVPANSGKGTFPLRANRGNIAMFWSSFNSFTTYVQQIRQTGKSLNIRALVTGFHHFWGRNSTHILFTKGDLRKGEIKQYKDMRELLPPWMWYLTKKDSDNSFEFTTDYRKNITRTYVPQGDPVSANNVGRGQTPSFVTPDEGPFLDYAEHSIPALMASTTAAFDEARKKGAFHGIVYTTTAGDLSTDSGAYFYNKIKKKGMFFSEMLFDCKDREDALQMIKANGGGAPYIDISFNHRQLGYSDEWLREKIAEVPASRDKIKRDYLGQWTFGSSNNPIPEPLLNKIRDFMNEQPIVRKEDSGYLIRYHVPIEEALSRKSVMGLDTSNAVNRDSITGVMIDVETSETLLTFGVNETSLNKFAFWLVDFLTRFKNCTLIPENKSTWLGIYDNMATAIVTKDFDPGRRIFSAIVEDALGTENDKRNYREYTSGPASERKYFQYRNNFGFMTDGARREELYVATLKAATSQSASLIRDAVLIDELSTLVERNNRIDHKASGHDDYVISWLMAHWFLRNGRNLQHYGIDPRTVLSRVRITASGNNAKELAVNMREEKLAQDIADLEVKVGNARTLMEERYLSARLQSLKSQVRVSDDILEAGSVDRHSAEAKVYTNEKAKMMRRGGIFNNGISLGRRR